MRVLLDTRILLWALAEPHRLSVGARETLQDRANDILFSAASIWEIAIKAGLGRSDFALDPAAIAVAARRTGFVECIVDAEAAARVATLPPHHRDPFDRLLIAQALTLPARLCTVDPWFARYTELVLAG